MLPSSHEPRPQSGQVLPATRVTWRAWSSMVHPSASLGTRSCAPSPDPPSQRLRHRAGVGERAYVAFKCMVLTPRVPKAWSGFVRFLQERRKTALTTLRTGSGSANFEGNRPQLPLRLSPSSALQQPRWEALLCRTSSTHQEGYDAGDSSVAGYRSTATVCAPSSSPTACPPAPSSARTTTTPSFSGYHAWMNDVLEPITDDYRPHEVFSGGPTAPWPARPCP
jgi:hypothetical protein